MANYPELVPRIRNLRAGAGLTRAALSEASGVDAYYIVKYENGTLCPYGEKASAIASALGVTVDALIGKYNTKLWESVLRGSEDMDRIHGARHVKGYVDFMRPIIEGTKDPAHKAGNGNAVN